MGFTVTENDDDEAIIECYKSGDWRKLLKEHHRNRFLPWIWPNEENLIFLTKTVKSLGSSQIVSIGCGSGLLEWLIQQATGMTVKGVEVDRSWWASQHSKSFLKLEFCEDFYSGYSAASETDAILFCYFNNEPAFVSYLDQYKGNCLVVIGPGEERGTHTAPTPFLLPLKVAEMWELYDMQEVKSGKDFIGIFRRRKT